MKIVQIITRGLVVALCVAGMVATSAPLALAQASLTVSITAPADGVTVAPDQTITFKGNATGGTGFYSYVWNFGDGTQAGGKEMTKSYTSTGAKRVTLTVTDTASKQGSASITVNVVNQSELGVVITKPANNSSATVGQSVEFSAIATGGTGFYSYVWNFGDGTQAGGKDVSKMYTSTGNRRVTVTVTDTAGKQTSASINLTITTGGGSEPLTISNLRVTDVGTTSAIVRWTTNRPADSRVIYDTTSHSSVSGQNPPNFGYASSTGASDQTIKVTEHAVTVSGLSPDTTYYFRALSQE